MSLEYAVVEKGLPKAVANRALQVRHSRARAGSAQSAEPSVGERQEWTGAGRAQAGTMHAAPMGLQEARLRC